jgi:hypothetical protein
MDTRYPDFKYPNAKEGLWLEEQQTLYGKEQR